MPYDVIYIDPPWEYDNKKTGGSHTSGSAQKYECLSVDQLAQLPIKSIASKDAVCALWATTPFGSVPYNLLATWGFKYKTELYWHKTGRKGTGYWLRGAVEKLLIGVRGDVRAWRSNIDNWQEFAELDLDPLAATPLGHSQKPEGVIRLLEQVTPHARRRIELFASAHSAALANKPYEGRPESLWWNCYGLDLGFDVRQPQFWVDLLHPASIEAVEPADADAALPA